jgi:uncharacterized transporter YbjL
VDSTLELLNSVGIALFSLYIIITVSAALLILLKVRGKKWKLFALLAILATSNLFRILTIVQTVPTAE